VIRKQRAREYRPELAVVTDNRPFKRLEKPRMGRRERIPTAEEITALRLPCRLVFDQRDAPLRPINVADLRAVKLSRSGTALQEAGVDQAEFRRCAP
jgi:hypothetical protein